MLHFGIKRLACSMSDEAQATLASFNAVCSYIGSSDLVQEHLVFRV
jgi:hypothetical protein